MSCLNKINQTNCDKDFNLVTSEQIEERLRISITSKCNYRCFFCHSEGKFNKSLIRYLNHSLIYQVIKEAGQIGFNSYKLTGGEPLLYEDGEYDILDLVSLISSLKKENNFELSLVTNGSLLRPFAQDLKKAGLDRITISLHSLRNDYYKYVTGQHKFSLDDVLGGLETALKANLRPLKINVVLFKNFHGSSNISEFEEYINLADDYKIDQLRFYLLVFNPIFKDKSEFLNSYVSWDNEEIKERISNNFGLPFYNKLINYASNLSSINLPMSVPGYTKKNTQVTFDLMSFRRLEHSFSCKKCNRRDECQEGKYSLRLLSDGSIKPCLLTTREVKMLPGQEAIALKKAMSMLPDSIPNSAELLKKSL